MGLFYTKKQEEQDEKAVTYEDFFEKAKELKYKREKEIFVPNTEKKK